jgi:CDP-diacylglycerol--glycerol-3-phosphate 3-phosphatidyltransferase
MANALTGVRVVLIVPFTLLMLHDDRSSALLAGLVLLTAIATDVLDGVVARRRGAASAGGGLFDHTADCLFVTAGLAAGAARGVVPWLLPVLVAAAFAQYVVDSYWIHRQPALRTSALGRCNGILYFAPLAGDVLARAGAGAVRPAVTTLAWVLVGTTVLSMGERLRAVRRASQTAPGSPVAGTGDRPPR